MTKDDVIRLAREAVSEKHEREFGVWLSWEELEAFAKLVAEHEREVIADQFWGCVMSDLEHGVKSLNKKAAFDFQKNMPDLSNFGRWLNERGQA